MGALWQAFEDYNLDRARTPTVQAALATPDGAVRHDADPAGCSSTGSSVPTDLIWGRHDLATPLELAERRAQRYGWRLHVLDDCGDDPPIEQPEAFVRALGTPSPPRPR